MLICHHFNIKILYYYLFLQKKFLVLFFVCVASSMLFLICLSPSFNHSYKRKHSSPKQNQLRSQFIRSYISKPTQLIKQDGELRKSTYSSKKIDQRAYTRQRICSTTSNSTSTTSCWRSSTRLGS